MLHRYSFSALLVTSLILGSCTSSTEVKKNDSALPMLKPVDEITALESSLAKDSSNKELKLELASRYYAAGDLVKASVLYNKVYQQDTKNLIAITNHSGEEELMPFNRKTFPRIEPEKGIVVILPPDILE